MALESTERQLLEAIWNWLSKDDVMPKKADAIVIGGDGKEVGMATRAAELFHEKRAPLIVASGWSGPNSRTKITEAEHLSRALIKKGVPKNAILLEPTAANTGDNITKSCELLKSKEVTAETIILIHKPYMSRRFFATAKAQWPSPQPELYVTHEHISFEDYLKREGEEEVIWKMLGDFKRMEEYAKNGFQIKQTAPADVQKAYQALVSRGHTTR